MNTSSFSFDISPSDSTNPLGVEVWVNDQQVADYPSLDHVQNIVYVFDDDNEQAYTVNVVVKNKTSSHTEISETGKIIRDSLVHINNFKIDEIDIDKIVYEKAEYTHNFNGSQAKVKDRFYGPAGCNGTIAIKFTTPGYLWILENM